MLKSNRPRGSVPGLVTGIVMLLFVNQASAYIGPGLGLGAISVALGILGSIVLAIFGLFWYPIKRILNKRKAGQQDQAPKAGQTSANDPDSTPADNDSRPIA